MEMLAKQDTTETKQYKTSIKARQCKANWRNANKDKIKQYYEEHKQQIKEYVKNYKVETGYNKFYYQKNREKLIKAVQESQKRRKLKDIETLK